jgi:hypothetical protein
MTCSALEKKGDICHPRFTALEKATRSPPTFQKEAHTQYPLGKKRGSRCIYSQDNATWKKRTHKAKPILKKKHNFREKDVSRNQDINQCSH